ncbi:MAG: HAD hydrolase-like protein [Candidatus Marinimicrobia bacterium]|nr:HAD hydrolase-like protein [Candidatus Neomarinimicrobiota bacterium]
MFNPQTDMLALDFDGVILDSIEECLVVGYNALAIQQNRPERIERLAEIDQGLAAEARRQRNFIRHGQDFVYIHLALRQGFTIRSQQDFDHFLEENEIFQADFRMLFYRERARFIKEDLSGWMKLNPFYPGVQQFLEGYHPKSRLLIITSKLKENIQTIFQARSVYFPDGNIYSANQKASKFQIIEKVLDKNHINGENFHFIEDQVDTLIRIKPLGINCYLAGWGYNNAEQVNRARNAGIPILYLPDLAKIFLTD